MRRLSSYLSLRVVLFSFIVIFLILTVSAYLSEKKIEVSVVKELEIVHKTKISLANEILKNDSPINLNTETSAAIQMLLIGNQSCETSATSTCEKLNSLIQANYFSNSDYKDIAIFNAAGARVFYSTVVGSQRLTPGELKQRPSENSKFSKNSLQPNTFIGKAGTTPNGTILVAFEILSQNKYLGTITFIISQKSFDLYGKNTGGNYTTYAVDSSGNVRNLSNPNASAVPSSQVLDACKAKTDTTVASNTSGDKIFSAVSYVPQIDLCVVTETNNLYSSSLGTGTYLTNYILGLILLGLLWVVSALVGKKVGKRLISIREKIEATLLGKEVEQSKVVGIQELDDLNKTFDFILHKLKTGRNTEESTELLQKNILQKAKSTTSDALASRDKFKEAVDSAQDIIILLTPTGLVTYANKALEKTTGFRLENVEGKYPYETWHKESGKEEFTEAIKNIITNKTLIVMNSEGRRGDGASYESEIRLSPIENTATGAVDSILMVERDISDERQRDRVKNEFISVVSHELRTPMTVIRGYSALLAEGKLGELNTKQKEYIERINAETSRLLDLANDMLDLQKFDAGKADLHLEKIDVRELLKDTVNEFEPLFNKKGLTLNFEDHTENAYAPVDKRYLNRAITNLVQNAFKFTEKGGVNVFTVNPDKDYVVIAIKDSGSGIPQEALPHLFTKFYQASNVLNRKQEGSGLGLSIVKKIVEAHKGIVWVESLEGKGTTFYIALPVV